MVPLTSVGAPPPQSQPLGTSSRQRVAGTDLPCCRTSGARMVVA